MEINFWTAENLWKWVQSTEYLQKEAIPISPIRAWSQIHNPRLKPEDVLLISFTEKEELIAYLGFLPDLWENQSFAWMSCLWVRPDQRGKSLARKLLDLGLEAWNNRLIATEFSPEAASLYLKSGKFPIKHQQNGLRFFFRHRWAKRIPERKPKLNFLTPIFKGLDVLGNIYQNFIFPKSSNQHSNINELQQSVFNFVQNPIQRNTSEIQWIIKFPWIISELNASEIDKQAASKYHFSSVVEECDFHILQNHEEMALLSYREGHWKIPYLSGKHLNEEIIQFISQKGDMLSVYQPDFLNTSIQFPSIFKKKIQRIYLLSSGFAHVYKENNIFQDGDGDCVFT